MPSMNINNQSGRSGQLAAIRESLILTIGNNISSTDQTAGHNFPKYMFSALGILDIYTVIPENL